MFRRKLSAAGAIVLLSVVGVLAGCTSAPLTDVNQILSKTQSALKNMKSVHFRMEATGEALLGVDTLTASPSPSASAAASGSAPASGSASAAASGSASAAASGSAPASGSASASASASAAASGSAEPCASAAASSCGSAPASASAAPSGSQAPTASPSASASASSSVSASPEPSASGASSTSISLAGTYAEGDIDMANKNAHFEGSAPGIPGFSGEMIIVGTYTYIRMPGQTKYALTGTDSLSINAADSKAGPMAMVRSIVDIAADKALQPRLVGMEDVLGNTCYHVQVTVTPEVVQKFLGLGGSAVGNGRLDLWILQDSFNLRMLEFHSSDPTAGSVALRLSFSNFDAVEEIKAPPPEQFEIPALQSAGY